MPTHSERDPVECLAEEFAERLRRGERPALSDYVRRCPDRADEIRDLFPTLAAMEQLKPRHGDLSDEPAPFDLPTDQLGDYRLLGEIGRGGMGVVYEAEQLSLGRHVALKVLPVSARLNPTYVERFRREAKAAAKLHHTNIVPVFGVGEASGVSFYAMQFIPGEGLDKVLDDLRRLKGQPTGSPASPLPGGLSSTGPGGEFHRGVARVGLQVAEALAYAHKQGVLHRDIKPSNLLLDAQGTVWVTDFGLAKAEGSDELTTTGDIVGTLRFMAPERFDGRSLPQSDVYALGLTLYELLTLTPAFADANKARLIEKVLHETPAAPRTLDPGIPRDLETVVLKCLAKEPKDRYDTADALADDLRRFLADRPIKARRAGAAERLWRLARRNPALAALTAALLLLLLVMAAGGWTLSASRGEALREAREKLLASYVAEARAGRHSGQPGQRFGTLKAIRNAAALARELGEPAATFDELRELAVATLRLPDVRFVGQIDDWPADCDHYGIDDAMALVVRGDARGTVAVLRLADQREVARLQGDGGPRGVGWDRATGLVRLCDFASGRRLLWDYASNELTRTGVVPADPTVSYLSHPVSGQVQAWVHRHGTVEPTTAGRPPIRLGHWPAPRPNARDGVPAATHPYRNLHAVSFLRQAGAVVHVLDLDCGEVVAELRVDGQDDVGLMGWMPDGRTLVVGFTTTVVQWDVPTDQVVHTFTHRGGGLYGTANALGDVVTVSSWAGGAKLWHGATGELLLNMPGVRCGFHSRGNWFLGTNHIGTPKQVWQLCSAPECRTLVRARVRGAAGDYWRCAIHPNGRLAAAGTTKGVTLFDLDTGADVGLLDLGECRNVTFDPEAGDLITYGETGLFRWPVRCSGEDARQVQVGPPRRLPLAGRRGSAAVRVSRDGKTLAVAQGENVDHVVVLHSDEPSRPVILKGVEDVRSHLAISPDGRWVATGRNDGHGGDIRVWDAGTGKVVNEFGIRDGMNVAFSPDGEWLVANDKKQYRFYHVGTWEEGPQPPVATPMFVDWPPAFSPDGLLALERGDGAIRLIDVASGRDVVVLQDPQQGRAGEMTFSPDGTRLLVVNKEQMVLRLWDLRRLRAGLNDLGLDWAAAEYPAGTPAVTRGPLEVEVARGGS